MTYSGLLDDVVDRHKITPEVDENFFNRSILRNIFFSGRIYLNDGYLVNHPASLHQLMNEDSVLRLMIRNNFIKILARQKDADEFAKNPERMAERGVLSFKKLVDQKDWPDLRKKLYRWADGLYEYNLVDPWPKYKMHVGFRKLFHRIVDKELPDLGLTELGNFDLQKLYKDYESHPSYENAPRTAIEEVLKEWNQNNRISKPHVAQIMNIANQCYHYNFAMCLSADKKEPVIADTTIGLAFEDLLDLDQTVEAEIDQFPILTIPRGFPVDNGSIFDVMLDFGSEINHAKHDFLFSIEKLFTKGRNQSAKDISLEVKDASERYQNYLAEHFADRVGLKDWAPKTSALITFGLGKLGSAFASDNIMVAANLATSGRASSFIHKMTKPLRRRVLEVAFNPDAGSNDEFTFKVGDVRPRFASLAFDRQATKNHVVDIPMFEP